MTATGPDFAGPAYERDHDHARLTSQLDRIYLVMSDHHWRTVGDIGEVTGDPGASILAQLGHLRKERFGSYLVEKRIRGRRQDGLYEYRVGERGGHVPRRNPMTLRAERAEELAGILAETISIIDPDNVVLLAYYAATNKRGRT